MTLRLADIAVRYGCELHGDPDALVSSVATLENAQAGSISFLANPTYRAALPASQATAVILSAGDVEHCNTCSLVARNPYAVYAQVAQQLYPEAVLSPGIDPGARTGSGCSIPASCQIAAGVVIGNDVTFGEDVYVGPNCVIGDGVTVGASCRLLASVTLYYGVVLGSRCRIHAGTVIGSDGFGMAPGDAGWIKVPQVGRVMIGDDVEIGANCCIDRGAIEDTVIGNDVKLDNQVQIAHNVIIGDHTAIAGQSGVAGSARVGARCLIGGSVAISGHLEIADDVNIMGRGSVNRSITKKGTYAGHWPVEEAGSWRRMVARSRRLEDMARRLKKLESLAGDAADVQE